LIYEKCLCTPKLLGRGRCGTTSLVVKEFPNIAV
jgi:hypothetical protein